MKKIASVLLCFILTLGGSTTIFAADIDSLPQLPHNGATHFEVTVRDDKGYKVRTFDYEFITLYGYSYNKSSIKSGAWRNGTSGGSKTSSSNLSLNYSNNTMFNTSFTATVSGSYTNAATIGSQLGVTLGSSKSYSLGSGYSVTVPKGSRYLIKYRPKYYTYTVVETKYKERYNPSMRKREKYVVGTKTCKVDVFSHWEFTHVTN